MLNYGCYVCRGHPPGNYRYQAAKGDITCCIAHQCMGRADPQIHNQLPRTPWPGTGNGARDRQNHYLVAW